MNRISQELSDAVALVVSDKSSSASRTLILAIAKSSSEGVIKDINTVVAAYKQAAIAAGGLNPDTLKSRKSEWEQVRRLGAARFLDAGGVEKTGYEMAKEIESLYERAGAIGGFRDAFKRGATWLLEHSGERISKESLAAAIAGRSKQPADLLNQIAGLIGELHLTDATALKTLGLVDAAKAFAKADEDRLLGPTAMERAASSRRKGDDSVWRRFLEAK